MADFLKMVLVIEVIVQLCLVAAVIILWLCTATGLLGR